MQFLRGVVLINDACLQILRMKTAQEIWSMPIFFDPLLLFIHIPKNAGRSIEKAFMDAEKKADWGRPNPINRFAHLLGKLSRSEFAIRHLVGTQDIPVAAQHLTYAEIELLGLMPKKQPVTTFTVCRNPFDRVVSSVTHFMGPQENASAFELALAEWLDLPLADHNIRAHRRKQVEFVLDSRGRPAIQEILRFENLEHDFLAFTKRIGRTDLSLPWRGKAKARSRNLSDIFSERAYRLVKSAYGEDLEFFRYRSPRRA